MQLSFSDNEIIIDKKLKSIFLAGPTLRDKTFEESWRKEAVNILKNLGFDGIVYIPEYSKGNNPIDFCNQAEWERIGLMNADIIIFYIPRHLPELPGFTTNVEFGMYLTRRPENVFLCSPVSSQKMRYLEWLYMKEKPYSKIFRTLDEILTYIVINCV